MSKFAGHTELGKKLNRISSKVDTSQADKLKTARGIILKPYNGLYYFTIGLFGPNGQIVEETRPIQLIGTPDQLAMMYGSPENMSRGQGEGWEVIVFYNGMSVDTGVALVTRRIYDVTGSSEAAKVANELVVRGTAWAPPGAGV